MNSNIINLWIGHTSTEFYPISEAEEKYSNYLPNWKKIQYRRSRGYARQKLSKIFNKSHYDIPLYAPPNKKPRLAKGYGFLSISHTSEKFLIGWSSNPIGVDIESIDRQIPVDIILAKYFKKQEINKFNKLGYDRKRKELLRRWVINEAVTKLLNEDLYLQWELAPPCLALYYLPHQ